jgi:hypothetical protein
MASRSRPGTRGPMKRRILERVDSVSDIGSREPQSAIGNRLSRIPLPIKPMNPMT